MSRLNVLEPGPASDSLEDYYQKGVRRHGQRHREFHWPSMELLFNFVYTYDVIESKLARRLGAHGLSLSAFNVLMILSRSGPEGCALHELSKLLVVSRANITGLVRCLVEKRLIERVEDERDRRVRIARITVKGEKLLEKVLPGYYLMVREMLGRVSRDENRMLNNLLSRMRKSVQQSGDKPSAGKEV
ncbi:MAG: MarR family transcriptional regulator, negative regulator of the multidrug operon emrRAB [Blastocatellia bacterium]|nr:MarR family transcriptional regulator, negative regulator of the multidrug operon emrRAB [Blastocatellia bacterium]